MPQFEGTNVITLQPNDINVPYKFEFTVCSGTTTNDGAIPSGHTLSSAVVTAHRIDGTVVTTGLVANTSMTGFVDAVWLSYPTSVGTVGGRYHIQLLPTISDGTTTYTKEFNFNRIVLKDL